MKKQWFSGLFGPVLVVASLLISSMTLASELDLPTLTVSGEARLSVPADFASFSIGVQNSAALAQTALDENSRLMQRVQQALVAAGVGDKEISSGAFSVQPQWQPRPRGVDADWRPAIVGYQVRTQLLIETAQLEKVANYIQSGVDAGANQVSQLRFSLQDDERVYQQALVEATTLARQRADVSATAAGVTLGALYRIDVDPATAQPYQNLRAAPRALMASESSVAMPVVAPGEIEVRGRVQLTYRLQ